MPIPVKCCIQVHYAYDSDPTRLHSFRLFRGDVELHAPQQIMFDSKQAIDTYLDGYLIQHGYHRLWRQHKSYWPKRINYRRDAHGRFGAKT